MNIIELTDSESGTLSDFSDIPDQKELNQSWQPNNNSKHNDCNKKEEDEDISENMLITTETTDIPEAPQLPPVAKKKLGYEEARPHYPFPLDNNITTDIPEAPPLPYFNKIKNKKLVENKPLMDLDNTNHVVNEASTTTDNKEENMNNNDEKQSMPLSRLLQIPEKWEDENMPEVNLLENMGGISSSSTEELRDTYPLLPTAQENKEPWKTDSSICWPVEKRDPNRYYFTIEDLTTHSMDHILSFLKSRDILNLSLVNRLWYNYVTTDSRFIKSMVVDDISISLSRLQRLKRVPKSLTYSTFINSSELQSNTINLRSETIKCNKSETIQNTTIEHMNLYRSKKDADNDYFEKERKYETTLLFIIGYSIFAVLAVISICWPFVLSHSNPDTSYWWLFAYVPLAILNVGYVGMMICEWIYQRYNPILTMDELRQPNDKTALINLKSLLFWVSYLIFVMLIKLAFLQAYPIWKYLVIPGTVIMVVQFICVWLRFAAMLFDSYNGRKQVVFGFAAITFCVFSMFAACSLSVHLAASKLDGDQWIAWCPWTVIFTSVYYVSFVFIFGTPICIMIFIYDEISSCFYVSLLFLSSLLVFGLLFSPFYLTALLLGLGLDGYMPVPHWTIVFIPFYCCCWWMPIFLSIILYMKEK